MRILFIMTAVLLLESCGTVDIKDEILYGNKGMLGAVEFHTLTKDKVVISFADWMKLLRTKPLICTSVDTAGDVKAEIEKVCSVCHCCSYDTTAAADEIFQNIKDAEEVMKK